MAVHSGSALAVGAPGSGARTGRRATRHALIAFFALAYVLSWSWLVPQALAGQVVRPGEGWPTHFPALLGPLLAAVAVTAAVEGRAGLADLGRRMVRARVPLRWWLAAVSPVLILPVALAVEAVLGKPLPVVADFARFSGLPVSWGLLGVLAAILLVNTFGEETGWRGFALPYLQRSHGPLTAALIIAPLWALWHLPMFFVVSTFRSFTAVEDVGWFLGLTCGSIVLAWLYIGSGGSILLVAVWHATYNIVGGTAAAHGLLGALVSVLVMTQAGVIAVVWARRGRRERRERRGRRAGATAGRS